MVRPLRLFAGLGALWLLQSACDPCAGAVPACSDTPRLVVMGSVVNFNTGRAIDGANISLVRRRGSGVVDSIAMTTDGTGYFQFSLDPDGDSLQHFDLDVRPRGQRGYRVVDATAPLVHGRGEAYPLGMLTDRAFYTARFANTRRCSGLPVRQAGQVTIRHVSGPAFIVDGTKVDSLIVQLLSDGEAVLPVGMVEVDSVATLVATARLNGGSEKLIAGFRLEAVPYFQQRPPLVLAFAPESTFVACVVHRGSEEPLSGITVDFVRTGGAATARASATVTTDSLGRAILNLGPLERGDVIGDLTVPGFEGSSAYVVRNIAIPAADGFLAQRSFGVGLQLPYFGLVSEFNTATAGVRVTVKRTGGIAAQPDSLTSVTGTDGRFNASAFRITSPGDLVVSVTITPPAPQRAFRIDDVHLTAIDGESHGIIFMSVDLGNPPPGSVTLSRAKVGAP